MSLSQLESTILHESIILYVLLSIGHNVDFLERKIVKFWTYLLNFFHLNSSYIIHQVFHKYLIETIKVKKQDILKFLAS